MDYSSQEILPASEGGSRAADGQIVPGAAMTGGQFLDQLSDGEISEIIHQKLRNLAAEMADVNKQTGKKTKGSITLKLDFELEDGVFKIANDIKVKAPEIPRPRSVMWTDDNNRFTRFPPGQSQLFGARSVGGSGGIRSI